MRDAFRHQVLRRYEIQYFQCPSCGFLCTEPPYWLDEAYCSAIATADTGLLQRNLYLARAASLLFWYMFRGRGKFLDAAGGYGVFTRLMRDIGFDYYWSDPHAQNLLARGYDGEPDAGPYAAVTAFEVLEHLADPVTFVSDLLRTTGARTCLVSTELFVGDAPDPGSWWYYAFETGQHIGFFRRSTLQAIATRLGLHLYCGRSVYLWTDQVISPSWFQFITHHRTSALLSWFPRLRLTSRVWTDHLEQLQAGGHTS